MEDEDNFRSIGEVVAAIVERVSVPTTKADFIAGYVRRARSVGFEIEATEDGCVYAHDPEDDFGPVRMFAAPCDCGCADGWAMFEVDDAGAARWQSSLGA